MSSATVVCGRLAGSPASARRSSGPEGAADGRASGISAGGVGRKQSPYSPGYAIRDDSGAELNVSAAGVETMIGGGSGRTGVAATTAGADTTRGESATCAGFGVRAASCVPDEPS